MCGYWKVYDDVEQARRIFDSYDKCREFTAAQIRAGYSILQVVGMKHLCTSQMCVNIKFKNRRFLRRAR